MPAYVLRETEDRFSVAQCSAVYATRKQIEFRGLLEFSEQFFDPVCAYSERVVRFF